ARRPCAREARYVPIAAAALLLHLQKTPRIGHGACDLQPVADDARISQQASHISLSESCYLLRVEVFKRLLEVISLAQDRDPAQPRLKALENEHLEDLPILMDRHAPFLVMI